MAYQSDINATQADKRTQANIIAKHNDIFRQSIVTGYASSQEQSGKADIIGQIVVTAEIEAMGLAFVYEALDKTVHYENFDESHDPHQCHEMGVIEVQNQTVWWIISLYDPNYIHGSEEPTDPNKTRRVLTILFPSDY